MITRKGSAEWRGDLKGGKGHVKTESGVVDADYSFASRFENARATNPEELIGAAHAGCFAMALSHGLSQAGHKPTRVAATAKVKLEQAEGGFRIPVIELECEAEVPGIDDKTFQAEATKAKENCPVSKVLAGAQISLTARLKA